MTWNKEFDLSTIPDAALRSEWCRRNARKRKSYTGGLIWKRHNPNHKACRCEACMRKRHGQLLYENLAAELRDGARNV